MNFLACHKLLQQFKWQLQVYATGYGAGGRLGIGGTDSVCQPNLLESIQHVFIKQVSEGNGGG